MGLRAGQGRAHLHTEHSSVSRGPPRGASPSQRPGPSARARLARYLETAAEEQQPGGPVGPGPRRLPHGGPRMSGTGGLQRRAPGRGTLSQVLESREQSVSVPRAGAASRVGAWTQVAETAGRRATGGGDAEEPLRQQTSAQGRRPAPRGRALGRLSPQPSCLRPGLSRRPSSLTVGPRTTGPLSPTRPPGPPGLTSSVRGSRGGGRQ